ncbi:4Fe-4S dicluster domain-containing protein [Anaeroselena agilis]|uniref:4Fe-4S dicluster domain-containing protein n=1 Tax=Anaeroselena agilis TaxID=3063788 RepID=A0ABU3NX64_9FIRM|nr:4Fe-4S dicluster domain-containing protein [Selenomonadales bacterium 4137-cl]
MQVSEVTKIRRKVLAEVSRMALEGDLVENIADILSTVVSEDGPRYRCCVHKERAVLKDRINMALSQPIGTPLTEAAGRALAGERADLPAVNLLPEACDRCPIDKFLVTDACRNCLAHNCIASCPKKAIMVVQNRAYIDKTACIECGMCKRSCAYGAIIEISRPCERACDLKAIVAGSDRRAVIDYDKCVQCGACKVACPFGAISERSDIVQLIQRIKAGHSVYALLAPAFIGQFGPKVRPEQIVGAIGRLGFHSVREVALGADAVALAEAGEFARAVPAEQPYLTTSCCPAFVAMVEKHLPDAGERVSTTVSPMVAAAKTVKEEDPSATVVFIGPCVAKKAEARRYPDLIDFVLTFEELAAMFVGAGLNVAEIEAGAHISVASRDGIGFARAGGVTQAVCDTVAKLAPGAELKPQRAEGLADCLDMLSKMQRGSLDANFLEAMACTGGCVGGPGTMADPRLTAKLLELYAAAAQVAAAPDNPAAKAENDLHRRKNSAG